MISHLQRLRSIEGWMWVMNWKWHERKQCSSLRCGIRDSEYKGQCTLSVRLRLEHGRFLTLEDATYGLFRNVGKEYHYSLRNSAEERSSYLLVTFPRQQWLRERGSMLRYTFIACLCTVISQWTIDRNWWRVGREATQLVGQYSGVHNVLLYITDLRTLFQWSHGKSNALRHQKYW